MGPKAVHAASSRPEMPTWRLQRLEAKKIEGLEAAVRRFESSGTRTS